jgi:hypothetical protein
MLVVNNQVYDEHNIPRLSKMVTLLMTTIICIATPCTPVHVHWLSKEPIASVLTVEKKGKKSLIFDLEDGNDTILRNAGEVPQTYMALWPVTQYSS